MSSNKTRLAFYMLIIVIVGSLTSILNLSRALAAPELLVNYQFNGNLNDSLSSSNITIFNANSNVLDSDVNGTFWRWLANGSPGGGLILDLNINIGETYSIGLRFSLSTKGPGWRRILDFSNRTSSSGLYFRNNLMTFFEMAGAVETGNRIAANNQVVDVILTLEGKTQNFIGYKFINGVLERRISAVDSSNLAVPIIINGKSRIGFFFDDGSEYALRGQVYSIKVWNAPISEAYARVAMAEMNETDRPVLSIGNIIRTSDTTGDFSFMSHEPGRYYFAVVPAGSDAPMIDTTVAGIPMVAGKNVIRDPAGMTSGALDLWIKARDLAGAGNVSAPLRIAIPTFVPPVEEPPVEEPPVEEPPVEEPPVEEPPVEEPPVEEPPVEEPPVEEPPVEEPPVEEPPVEEPPVEEPPVEEPPVEEPPVEEPPVEEPPMEEPPVEEPPVEEPPVEEPPVEEPPMEEPPVKEPPIDEQPTSLNPIFNVTKRAVKTIFNGREYDLGKITETIENGITVSNLTIEKDEFLEILTESILRDSSRVQSRLIQFSTTSLYVNAFRLILSGDLIKILEDKGYSVSLKKGKVSYILPVELISIENVATKLGLTEEDLEDVSIELLVRRQFDIQSTDFARFVKEYGYELLVPPIHFEVRARTIKEDGTERYIKISKFRRFVERVFELPEGLPSDKVVTGIVLNEDGTFIHIPTRIARESATGIASLYSLTNSAYSLIMNQVYVKSVEDHWARETVNEMASKFVITNHDNFLPNDSITRAEYID